MISSVLDEGIKAYGIGDKLRALRRSKGLGLVELGEHSGLSPGMLSKIERSRIVPTLPTLLRIAMVFGVGLDYFFSAAREQPAFAITRKDERLRFPDDPKSAHAAYTFECLDFTATERELSAYLADFEPFDAPAGSHSHRAVELIYVIRGRLGLTFQGREHVLESGDAVYLDGSVTHGYRRIGKAPCSALVVTVP